MAGAATGVSREVATAPAGGHAVGGQVWRGGWAGGVGKIFFFLGNRYCVEQIRLGGMGVLGILNFFSRSSFLKMNIILSKVSMSKYANLNSVQL